MDQSSNQCRSLPPYFHRYPSVFFLSQICQWLFAVTALLLSPFCHRSASATLLWQTCYCLLMVTEKPYFFTVTDPLVPPYCHWSANLLLQSPFYVIAVKIGSSDCALRLYIVITNFKIVLGKHWLDITLYWMYCCWIKNAKLEWSVLAAAKP